MNGVRIKICGLFRREDAQAVNAAMPDYAGFVFYEKSRRNVGPALARELRKALHRDIRTAGVFVDAPMRQIETLYQDGVLSIAQLHGKENSDYIDVLRGRCPGMEIWQAFRLRTQEDLVLAAGSPADCVLLDSGAGSGVPFNWRLAERFPRPFMLAGGLTTDNIPQAIHTLRPFGVDISSGVETDGLKDAKKITAAVRAARRKSG